MGVTADRAAAAEPAARMARKAIGVLGGTFDPVHVGHLAVADLALLALDLDRVMLVPARLPPHKLDRPVTDAAHREAMLRLAVAGRPRFEVSRIELERPGPSYAVDTVARLAAEAASEARPEPWFILSGEALRGFPDWRDPDRILALARIAVASRPGAPRPDADWLEERFPGRADRFAFLPGPYVSVSASEIRRRLSVGGPIDGLVPPAVGRYIMGHGLYQATRHRRGQHERSSA